MVTENSMELENQAFLSNQDITGEAPKLLLCSSIASGSDLGSNEGITPMAGIGKEYPELGWYYLYLSNKELKRYISVFRLSGNFWLVSFKISYLCLPLFYETRTTPSCHPSGCAYRQL